MSDDENFFMIGEVVTPEGRDAQKIEAENSDRPPPPGEYVFIVAALVGDKKTEDVSGFLGMYSTTFHCVKLGVKLVLENDPGSGVIDNFYLPPANPKEHEAYFKSTKEQNAGKQGFHANKFIHFIERIGFHWPAGTPMPADARDPRKWIGRKVVATVQVGKGYSKFNSQTGETANYEGRAQVKLFSYRPAYDESGNPIRLQSAAPKVAAPPAAQVRPPLPVAPPPAPRSVPADHGDTDGLDDIPF